MDACKPANRVQLTHGSTKFSCLLDGSWQDNALLKRSTAKFSRLSALHAAYQLTSMDPPSVCGHGQHHAASTAQAPTATATLMCTRCYLKDDRTVYNMVDDVARRLRQGTSVRHITQYCYWRRSADDAADRAIRLLTVPKSAGVRYFVQKLASHVPARNFEDLRRDPHNPVLINLSSLGRGAGVA